MSKPLATKVSTPLSENVQIGLKASIFCLATVIFQHCLNPLGHGVHQSFTGCHWSLLPLLHDDIRMPHRCSIGFRSGDTLGQSTTFTLSFFSKAVVVMLEYCRAAQSPKGGDPALLQYVTVHVGIHTQQKYVGRFVTMGVKLITFRVNIQVHLC